MDDRRKFSRILFHSGASLSGDKGCWQTRILDLSLNGALVESPLGMAPTTDVLTLSFQLPDSDIQLQMQTHIVHVCPSQIGLSCEHMDVDSISHLRRMLELNLGDASLLHRELEQLIESHEALK